MLYVEHSEEDHWRRIKGSAIDSCVSDKGHEGLSVLIEREVIILTFYLDQPFVSPGAPCEWFVRQIGQWKIGQRDR